MEILKDAGRIAGALLAVGTLLGGLAAFLGWELPPFPTKAELRSVETNLTDKIDVFADKLSPQVKTLRTEIAQLRNDLYMEKLLRLRTELFQIEDRCRNLKNTGASVQQWLVERERQLRLDIWGVEDQRDAPRSQFDAHVCP